MNHRLNVGVLRGYVLSLVAIGVGISLGVGDLESRSASADVHRWDNGETIPGTVGTDPGPGIDLSRLSLQYADFRGGINLSSSQFTRSDLTRALFTDANLTNVKFDNADLSEAGMVGATLNLANLFNADLSGAVLTNSRFQAANLSGAIFEGATLHGDGNVPGVDLSNATDLGFIKEQLYASGSYQSHNLSGIFLRQNDMVEWNFEQQNLTKSNFSGANLYGANLQDAKLTQAVVSGANLTHANLAGVSLQSAQLRDTDLAMANLAAANLRHANAERAILTGADLSQSQLQGGRFGFADLTGAEFTDAIVTNTELSNSQGLNATQLYSTASYQAGDLSGIGLAGLDLSGWDFSGQFLPSVRFTNSNLTNIVLADAHLNGAIFSTVTGLTASQIYSSASYQTGDLRGIRLNGNDLQGWDFSQQDLTDATFAQSQLGGADFNGATINDASFAGALQFMPDQLYSTESYQTRDLSGIHLGNDLTLWDFSGQDLSRARFDGSTLAGTNFTNSSVTGASFANVSDFQDQQFYSTQTYKDGDLSGISLAGNDLSGWNFSQKVLGQVSFNAATLVGASFRGSSLEEVSLSGADVTDADFGGAVINGALLRNLRGFSQVQLESTASYQAGDLRNVTLEMAGSDSWNLAGQVLSGTRLGGSVVTNGNFAGADVRGANFTSVLEQEQLAATASFKRRDLRGVQVLGRGFDYPALDLAGQNLSGAILAGFYADSDFTDATLTGATIAGIQPANAISATQIYSTASYKERSMRGIVWGTSGASFFSMQNWDLSGQDLSGGNFRHANLNGADLSDAWINDVTLPVSQAGAFSEQQLYETASYKTRNLQGVSFGTRDGLINVSHWNFARQDLSGASFRHATLVDTDFTGALVNRTAFGASLTANQLYSTASYQSGNLRGIEFWDQDLAGWNLTQKNLSNALLAGSVRGAGLNGANLSGADLRLAEAFETNESMLLDNAIWRSGGAGEIRGLHLGPGEYLYIRGLESSDMEAHDISNQIHVRDEFLLSPESTLELQITRNVTASRPLETGERATLVLDENVTPQLAGTFKLTTNEYGYLNQNVTLDLFDWPAPLPADNRFDRLELPSGDFNWDLSELYTSGDILVTPPLWPDYDANGSVDQGDLDLVLLHWGEEVPDLAAAGWHNFLPEGIVDQGELDLVLLNWGDSAAFPTPVLPAGGLPANGLGASGVPEPASFALLLLVLLSVISYKRIVRR